MGSSAFSLFFGLGYVFEGAIAPLAKWIPAFDWYERIPQAGAVLFSTAASRMLIFSLEGRAEDARWPEALRFGFLAAILLGLTVTGLGWGGFHSLDYVSLASWLCVWSFWCARDALLNQPAKG